MALGNGKPKNGDKGSNFSFELKNLLGLKSIKDAVIASSGGAGSVVTPTLTKVVGNTTETLASNTFIEVSIANVGATTVEFSNDGGTTVTAIDAGFEVSFRAKPGDKLAEIELTGTDPASTYYLSTITA
ncbi:MAG: hypothetical protein CMM25_00495 [Rhodospirillaceae bacterium]|nr:hypothetical protein [Rhodospirillaceae bacterium]|tara:strand:- start:471 stop:857 length:387 start_codon:yes stop_codon:yes gene_type:complete